MKNSPKEFYIELVIVNTRGKSFEYRASYATQKRLDKKMKKLEKQQKKGKQ